MGVQLGLSHQGKFLENGVTTKISRIKTDGVTED